MNILIVSIDSLRSDHAPPLGTQVAAPSFAASIRGFEVFSHCVSVASATRPVHASVFTGLYPFEHGVRGQRSPAMRPGTADLLTVLKSHGWHVRGMSEAPSVFTGLSFAPLISALDPTPQEGLHQLWECLCEAPRDRVLLFIHYWSTHTPYGAQDGRAFGEVGQLLAAGRTEEVKRRYARAARVVFEEKLAPLLTRIDPGCWAIVIFGDHGESWTPEEPYHGQSLRNAVLRVPLYLSIPGAPPVPDRAALVSLVDILPTLREALDLPFQGEFSGQSLLHPVSDRLCLAEIEPVREPDLPLSGAFRTSSRAPGAAQQVQDSVELQWCMISPEYKLTGYERTGRLILERTWSELPVHDPEARQRLLEAYHALRNRSPYATAAWPPVEGSDPLLEQRLRDLGYLD